MIDASFELVQEVQKHPEADKLDIINVSNYEIVVARDSLKVGDEVLYIRPDAALNKDVEKFLWQEPLIKYLGGLGRVKTVKLRGRFSNGIAIPTKDLNLHPEV